MIKKYQSKSCVSLSVLLENGNSLHVSFDGLTGGGSVFYTDNEELQTALANHPKFGRLFKEVEIVVPTKVTKPKAVVKKTAASAEGCEAVVDTAEDTAEEAEEETVATGKEVHVSCWEDAKNHLADTYGISRTKLRSQKSITEAAEANGIVFVFS
jgi:hypothetical protein